MDGSDDNNVHGPITINSDTDEDTDINLEDSETPAESAEAELGKVPMTEPRPVEIFKLTVTLD